MNFHISNAAGWQVHTIAGVEPDEGGWSRGSPAAMTLAKTASDLARGHDVLFRGTRYWRQMSGAAC